MNRAISLRAAAWLVLATCVCASLQGGRAVAQAVAVPTTTAQPTWIGQPPMFQVGPNGAVNLDQAQPYTAAQFPPATYPPQQYPPQQYPTQPYATQPWPVQGVAPQPAWGAPVMPQANVGGTVPYFFLHRTSVFGEFLFIRPRDAEVAYALPIEEPEFLSTDIEPVGPVALVDPDYEIGFRAGGNWALSEGNSIAAQFTRFRSESTSAASVGEGAVLFPLVGIPDDLIEIDYETASARHNIDFDQADIDFRGLWAGCECNNYAYAVNYLAGVEYATLDQVFSATFNSPEPIEDPGPLQVDPAVIVNSDVHFDGIGMRMGLQGERFFPNSGAFVYGNGITTILFGEFDATFQQIEFEDDDEEELPNSTSWSAGRVVPIVELELGAGWLGVNRHLRLSAGYRVSAWFNVVKTDDWLWAVQNHDFRDMDGTLTFDGVVGRAEWLF